MANPTSDDDNYDSWQAEMYSMQRQLHKTQQDGKAARAELKSAQAVAVDFERSFRAERQQRRKVSPCCAYHRSLAGKLHACGCQLQCASVARFPHCQALLRLTGA